ncbi:MAG: hypothetical protein C0404_15090 [Verrucomicrobia bacterium]|nr:hypothetical protein [Verrucomicrobiota bacterium]
MSAVSALVRKHIWQALNIRMVLEQQSPLKVVFIIVFAAFFEAGLCLLFLDAFKFLDSLGGIGVMVISRLFSLFFLGMGAMLAASGIVTSYTTVFRSDEIPFLFSRPLSHGQVAVYKFIESTLLSSWAFFFVIVPFVWAYGWHERLSPLFALWLFVFSLPFLAICSGIGTILTILMVRWMPPARYMKWPILIVAAAVALYFWRESLAAYQATREGQFSIASLAPGFQYSTNPLLPSWWISEGVLSLSNGQWFRGFMILNVMISSCLLIVGIISALGRRVFYGAWLRTVEGDSGTARRPVMFLRWDRPWKFINDQVRAIVFKDIRTFLRDPMQWSQALIFFGLLGLYFTNLRDLRYHSLPDVGRNAIAFLNIFSVSAVMCSLSSRFIYPQLSLEGQGFWIVGLSPVTMTMVLVTKFVTALVCMLAASITLMVLSTLMLGYSSSMMLVSILVAVSVSCAISALSTGLGSVFLDLRQRNPAAIVSGFGGTLNLVLCLAFMIGAILPFGLIFHFSAAGHITHAQFNMGVRAASVWLIVITVLTTVIPLRLGRNALKKAEF